MRLRRRPRARRAGPRALAGSRRCDGRRGPHAAARRGRVPRLGPVRVPEPLLLRLQRSRNRTQPTNMHWASFIYLYVVHFPMELPRSFPAMTQETLSRCVVISGVSSIIFDAWLSRAACDIRRYSPARSPGMRLRLWMRYLHPYFLLHGACFKCVLNNAAAADTTTRQESYDLQSDPH